MPASGPLRCRAGSLTVGSACQAQARRCQQAGLGARGSPHRHWPASPGRSSRPACCRSPRALARGCASGAVPDMTPIVWHAPSWAPREAVADRPHPVPPAGARRRVPAACAGRPAGGVRGHRRAAAVHDRGHHGLCRPGLPEPCQPGGAHDGHAAPVRLHGRGGRLRLRPPVQVLQGAPLGADGLAPGDACCLQRAWHTCVHSCPGLRSGSRLAAGSGAPADTRSQSGIMQARQQANHGVRRGTSGSRPRCRRRCCTRARCLPSSWASTSWCGARRAAGRCPSAPCSRCASSGLASRCPWSSWAPTLGTARRRRRTPCAPTRSPARFPSKCGPASARPPLSCLLAHVQAGCPCLGLGGC